MPQVPVRRVLAPNPSPMTATGTNTWIVGRGQVAVIDPGPDSAPHLDAILAALAPDETVTHIIVTHAHLDHSALAPALARQTGAALLAFGTATEGRSPQMQALADAGLAGGGEGLDPAFSPDIRLRDGGAVQGAGWRLDVLYTPGHLSGHICLALGDTLFTGDHVMGWAPSLVSPPDGDMGAYMAALRRLAERRWAKMLPGHGDTIDTPAARLSALIAHRDSREAAILAALSAGPADLNAIVTRVYADTPPALHPAAARNAFAHLADLAARGLVAATPALSPTATFRRT